MHGMFALLIGVTVKTPLLASVCCLPKIAIHLYVSGVRYGHLAALER